MPVMTDIKWGQTTYILGSLVQVVPDVPELVARDCAVLLDIIDRIQVPVIDEPISLSYHCDI